jgi:4-hydroxy-tetrahydrodipicolinate reductase
MSLGAALIGPGRMGSAVADAWRERGHRVEARIGRGDDLAAAAGADVAFELTTPDAAAGNVAALLALGVPTVCGTTGWDAAAVQRAGDGGDGVPLLVAPNFSIGVAVLRAAVAEAARRLVGDSEFEAGIVERHHAEEAGQPVGHGEDARRHRR